MVHSCEASLIIQIHLVASFADKYLNLYSSLILVDCMLKLANECSGAALDFSKGRWLDFDRGIITSTPAVHAALLKAVKEIDDEDNA